MLKFPAYTHTSLRLLFILSRLFCITVVIVSPFTVYGARSASATGLPTVTYDPTTNSIFIGEEYSDFQERAYPSRPDLLPGKRAMTLHQLSTELTAQGHRDLLIDQGNGIWLLKAHVLIQQTARLDIASPTVKELRLNSPPDLAPALLSLPPDPGTVTPAFAVVVALGGHLKIDGIAQGNCPEPATVEKVGDVGDCSPGGIRVRAWDSTRDAYDDVYQDGRSYLLAYQGGRMDIINADVGYLGWKSGEASGLAWRERSDDLRPETGSTGDIRESVIHRNYYGQYSYKAYKIIGKHNTMHENIGYGFDPHDYSQAFEFAYNNVFGNGNHGIIFSRGCVNNAIHHNVVHDNLHGIMLDRGSDQNEIYDNVVYGNSDGIAIFQSSDNRVWNNQLYENGRDGVRIEARYIPGDVYDGVAIDNIVEDNTIRDSGRYGFYVRVRADNNIIRRNTISGSLSDGVFIASGGNLIRDNKITSNNGAAIRIRTDDQIRSDLTMNPPRKGNLEIPGYRNEVYGNSITENGGGILLRGAVGTRIGSTNPGDSNTISENGGDGLSIRNGPRPNNTPDDPSDDILIGSTDNLVIGNTINGNERDGVSIRDPATQRNTVSRNSFVSNGRSTIRIDDGANGGILPPTLQVNLDIDLASGQTVVNGSVEIYGSVRGQSITYLGSVVANSVGNWSFLLPAEYTGDIFALVTDPAGNTSVFTGTGSLSNVAYEIGSDARTGVLTVYVNGSGAQVTLPMIKEGIKSLTDTVLLEDQGYGVWQANASIFIGRGVTLTIDSATTQWLKLRSQSDDIAIGLAAADYDYNYQSFVSLKTYNGTIIISNTEVTSWDPMSKDFDKDITNGRSYILAKYDARLDVISSTISYLGSPDGESYGLSWRDTNSTDEPDILRTRVTGHVINSDISYNYYGIYTYQASNMVFRGNKFRNNIGYGFDPHDYSNHFLVEYNEAYDNGNHGFIISRGCNNFIFRYNKSYNNRYTVGDVDRNAHGFMLDPGSPNSRYPQVPSFNNLYEYNEAWGQDGYGFRILRSNNNIIRNNFFWGNEKGMTLEQESTSNILVSNIITGNLSYGIYLFDGADANTVTDNQISNNGNHGLYVRTGGNTIISNTITSNGTVNGADREGAGIAALPETLSAPAAPMLSPEEQTELQEEDLNLFGAGPFSLASGLTSNQIISNTITGNSNDGIELRGAQHTIIQSNSVADNGGDGVQLAFYQSSSTGELFPAIGNIVISNTIRNHLRHGLWINQAEATTVEDNTIQNSAGYGIRAQGTISSTIRNNVIANSQQQGLSLEQKSMGNLLATNIVTNSKFSGIYLVSGSDNNTIVGNQIIQNGLHGVYLKTGGNEVISNTVASNGTLTGTARLGSGIALLPETTPAAALADFTLSGEDLPGLAEIDPSLLGSPALVSALTANQISGNMIADNLDDGIEGKGLTGTTISTNTIQGNGVYGIWLSEYSGVDGLVSDAFNNRIISNTISSNGNQGIRVNSARAYNNSWSENSIYDNLAGGIGVTGGANGGIGRPRITSVHSSTISGITSPPAPNALIEVFSDTSLQGRQFEGYTITGADGSFTFTAPKDWQWTFVTVVATDTQGNSSSFATSLQRNGGTSGGGTQVRVFLPLIQR